jgi:hypothetical protein
MDLGTVRPTSPASAAGGVLTPSGVRITDRWLVCRKVVGARREDGFIGEPDSPRASQRPERSTGPRLGEVSEGGLPVRFLPPGGGSHWGLALRR